MKPSSFHFNFLSKQIIEEFINTGPFKGFSLRIHAIFQFFDQKPQITVKERLGLPFTGY